jgi:tRNA U34 2-thiouridine synthase MnmA/TrmU
MITRKSQIIVPDCGVLIIRVMARLDDPITGVSPGQVLAVYMGDECLGSAKIRDTTTLGDGQ